MPDKINSFTQLDAWKSGHKLVLAAFVCCKNMSRYDVLRNQIERAALSITSNISEGFGRQSYADKKHFYIIARGSAYEVQNQLIVGRDLGSIKEDDFKDLARLSLDSIKLLHGLIRSLDKQQKANS